MTMKEKNNLSEIIFNKIGYGKIHALPRPTDQAIDRALRKKIEVSQSKGDIIINVGYGYYRPDLSVPEELAEYNAYIRQKKSKLRSEMITLEAMEKTANKYK